MSGIETVKIIVEAEKKAAKILNDAQNKAWEIRKRLDSMVETEREGLLRSAKNQASTIVERAESEGKTEAQELEKNSQSAIRQIVTRATAQKGVAVERLVALIMGSEQ
jgi:vacuolar-type H+-ATPase subunit H